MKQRVRLLTPIMAVCTALSLSSGTMAQTMTVGPSGIGTPDRVESRLGTMEYKDGVPASATVQTAYDNLDFMHAVQVYLNAFAGVSTYAIREGFLSIGAEDNQIVIFPRLMDSKSVFLTANADTVYFVGILDLTKGPMVLEAPPESLGTLDDMWFNWIIDFGTPVLTGGLAASIWCCLRATRDRCRKAAFMLRNRGRHAR